MHLAQVLYSKSSPVGKCYIEFEKLHTALYNKNITLVYLVNCSL